MFNLDLAARYVEEQLNVTVEIEEIAKANGVKLLAFVVKADEGCNIAPCIYINPQDSPEAIARQVIADYKKSVSGAAKMGQIVENLDKEYILNHILPEAVSSKLNHELIATALSRPILDLTLIYKVRLPMQTGIGIGTPSFILTKGLAESLGITEAEAFASAMEVSIETMDAWTMREMLKNISSVELPEEAGVPELIVVSNKDKLYGASVLTNPECLARVAEEWFDGESFYIIPSSIHEVLCLKDEGQCAEELNFLITEVNSTEVQAQEVLSDHAYRWENGTLSIVA